MNDTERLDWLEGQQGSALVSDDDKHWAVVTDGIQNVPSNSPEDISSSFWIGKEDWCGSVREAIDRGMKENRS